MKRYNTAIVGATGAVGQEFLKLIEERNFPFGELNVGVETFGGQENKFHGSRIHR